MFLDLVLLFTRRQLVRVRERLRRASRDGRRGYELIGGITIGEFRASTSGPRGPMR
jgi:hypothetical protein